MPLIVMCILIVLAVPQFFHKLGRRITQVQRYRQIPGLPYELQGIIDTRDKPLNDKTVEWLFHHPLSDGGTFTGVADIVGKYGLVPKEAMPETNNSDNTSRIDRKSVE